MEAIPLPLVFILREETNNRRRMSCDFYYENIKMVDTHKKDYISIVIK